MRYDSARIFDCKRVCNLDNVFQNRNLARACGSALLGRYLPELVKKIATGRWENVKRTDAKILVAACPQSTGALSAVVPEGYQYYDLLELLDKYC